MPPETERGHVPPARRATPAAPHQPCHTSHATPACPPACPPTSRGLTTSPVHAETCLQHFVPRKRFKWYQAYQMRRLVPQKRFRWNKVEFPCLLSSPARSSRPLVPPARPARSSRQPAPRNAAKQKKGGQLIQLTAFRADGETRTHTGQRPLPPQSSVSTISPHPHV